MQYIANTHTIRFIKSSTRTVYYFYIIVKMSLQPDEMASRVGFGPWAVVWRLLLYSIGVMKGSLPTYLTHHCQLTLPTSPRNILNIGIIHAKSEKQHTA